MAKKKVTKKKNKKEIDIQFISGFVLFLVLVLASLYAKEAIEWYMFIIPSLLMGFDVIGIIEAVRGK